MHTSNLGLAHLLIANCLVFLAMNRADLAVLEPRLTPLGPAASMDDVYYDLQLRFKYWLSDNGLECSCKKFTSNALHRTSWQEYPIFTCKAAQSPYLVGWLAELSIKFAATCQGEFRAEADCVAACLWGKSEYYGILRNGSRFFSAEEADRLFECGHVLLHTYAELRRKSIAAATCMWSIVPKFHQFQHILLDALTDLQNPRFSHCFSDEDFVGQMITAMEAVHHLTAVDSALSKYLMGLKERLMHLEP